MGAFEPTRHLQDYAESAWAGSPVAVSAPALSLPDAATATARGAGRMLEREFCASQPQADAQSLSSYVRTMLRTGRLRTEELAEPLQSRPLAGLFHLSG